MEVFSSEAAVPEVRIFDRFRGAGLDAVPATTGAHVPPGTGVAQAVDRRSPRRMWEHRVSAWHEN